jgi:hypothetical protein
MDEELDNLIAWIAALPLDKRALFMEALTDVVCRCGMEVDDTHRCRCDVGDRYWYGNE